MRQVPTSGDRWVWREGRVSIERAEMWKYSPMENAVVELMCTLVCGGRWTVQRWTQGRGWTEVQITWRRWMMMIDNNTSGRRRLPTLLIIIIPLSYILPTPSPFVLLQSPLEQMATSKIRSSNAVSSSSPWYMPKNSSLALSDPLTSRLITFAYQL